MGGRPQVLEFTVRRNPSSEPDRCPAEAPTAIPLVNRGLQTNTVAGRPLGPES